MVLNKFFINVLDRVTLIVLSSVILGIVLQHLDRGYFYTLAGAIFLIVFQTWMLVNQVNKTNSDLEKFFSSVQNHDSSIRFSDNTKNNSFRKLHDRIKIDITDGNQNVSLEFPKDFIGYASQISEFIQIENSDIVFVGYGINSPEK
jgi:hypothetical protein